MARFHEPVLVKKAIELLKIKKGKNYADATVGGGGHAEAICKLKGRLLGIDLDPEAIRAAGERLSQACPSPSNRGPSAAWRLASGNFADLKKIIKQNQFEPVSGILFDLGASTHQLKTSTRGFSFDSDQPLDMRMSPELKVTAADLVNGLNKGELDELFSKLAEERFSRRIAAAICRARRVEPIKTGRQLATIIEKVVPKRSGRIHPATRCFQALRIAVNDELNNLKAALPQAVEVLEPRGRLVVISFHSGEDRIVKRFFQENKNLKVITKKPIRPNQEEINANPASRSAKLRAAEKIKS
jgi:16S rRNA (cytosine1402-N4)-methyltransferase